MTVAFALTVAIALAWLRWQQIKYGPCYQAVTGRRRMRRIPEEIAVRHAADRIRLHQRHRAAIYCIKQMKSARRRDHKIEQRIRVEQPEILQSRRHAES